MAIAANVGVNPLPWLLSPAGFTLDVATLTTAFTEIAGTGFTAVQADVPVGMTAAEYARFLADFGLRPALGYFSAELTEDPAEIVRAARTHAANQAELGITEVFIASNLTPRRIAAPAVGADFDADRLKTVVDNLGRAAEAIRAERVRPCLHPHVGSWIETEREVRAALDGTDPGVLAFGPDTGHLFWGGMDPAALIAEYADRVGAVHLKDVHAQARIVARDRDNDYFQATNDRALWTEPGRGDIDLTAALRALPADFAGWFVMEVDVPDAGTPRQSTVETARWVSRQPRLSTGATA
jgi:inosose dehydratase